MDVDLARVRAGFLFAEDPRNRRIAVQTDAYWCRMRPQERLKMYRAALLFSSGVKRCRLRPANHRKEARKKPCSWRKRAHMTD